MVFSRRLSPMLFCYFLSFSGCVPIVVPIPEVEIKNEEINRPITESDLEFIEVGITKKDVVIKTLGSPDKVSSDEKAIEYCWSIPSAFIYTLVYVTPHYRNHCWSIEFDEHAKVNNFHKKSSSKYPVLTY